MNMAARSIRWPRALGMAMGILAIGGCTSSSTPHQAGAATTSTEASYVPGAQPSRSTEANDSTLHSNRGVATTSASAATTPTSTSTTVLEVPVTTSTTEPGPTTNST